MNTKPRLLHIALGNHNQNLKTSLDEVFECKHFDWTAHEGGAHLTAMKLPHLRRTDALYSERDRKAINLFNSFKPDYVFLHLQTENIFEPETIQEMASKAIIINWTGDVREGKEMEWYFDFAKLVHSTLFTNKTNVRQFKAQNLNSGYLQVGYDSTIFNPTRPVPKTKKHDIVFMGSNYGADRFPLSRQRQFMVEELIIWHGNRFGLYGTGWGQLADGEMNNCYELENAIYRNSKIGISLSHFDYENYFSDRLLRIMGSGCFCLSHRYTSIEFDFALGKEIETFDDFDEMDWKIKYYLKNEDKRKEIAAAGQKIVSNLFTWKHFAKKLKAKFENISSELHEKTEI